MLLLEENILLTKAKRYYLPNRIIDSQSSSMEKTFMIKQLIQI